MGVVLLEGSDVTNVYRYPSMYTASSMTGKHLSRFTKLYGDNPKAVKMAVATSGKWRNKNEDMLARALLWICDDGTKVLDGIYGCRFGRKLLEDWAVENKAFGIRTMPLSVSKFVRVTMDIKRDIFPFIDTFMFGEMQDDKKSVTLSMHPHNRTNVMFSTHEGFYYAIEKQGDHYYYGEIGE